MRSYLEIALRVANPAQSVHSEPRSGAHASTKQAVKQSHTSSVDLAATQRAQPDELAPCGSTDCAGCYDVGDGRKIHPPKIGEDYRKWLERWKPIGMAQ
jgi:hypothetical protein